MKNNIELYDHIMHVTSQEKYKKVDIDIILDTELTKNDLAIYLAILKSVNYDNSFTRISYKNISNITGINKSLINKSLNKLQDKGYIYSQLGENCIEYILGDISEKYIRIPLSYFDGLNKDIKNYTRKLRYLALSNGNNTFPSRGKCNNHTKISKEEYRILKSYESNLDVDIYESLKIKTSTEVKVETKVIALEKNDPRLKTMSMEQQLDALLG